MSKIYNEYVRLKSINKDKLYLFKNGKFYIFIADDADFINEYVVLKKVKFTNDVLKCGFPKESLDDYLRIFKNHNLDVELIDKYSENTIEEIIKKIDIDNITPFEALRKIKELKEMIK